MAQMVDEAESTDGAHAARVRYGLSCNLVGGSFGVYASQDGGELDAPAGNGNHPITTSYGSLTSVAVSSYHSTTFGREINEAG